MTRLVLAWHGSADPRSVANTHDVVDHVRRIRPSLDVPAAFLDHATPTLEDALSADRRRAVVVPMLLADAYHARVDIPHRISKSATEKTIQANVLGEDGRLVRVLRQRLAEAGVSPHDPGLGVIAVAVGSSHDAANARTATVAHALDVATRWAGASIAFATGPHPSLAETAEFLTDRGARRLVIAPWFLAPGRITDRVATEAGVHGSQMALPIGAHPLVAEVILDRYDAACSSPWGFLDGGIQLTWVGRGPAEAREAVVQLGDPRRWTARDSKSSRPACGAAWTAPTPGPTELRR